MKKIISAILVSVFALSLLAGCSKSKAIVGSWSYQQKTILNVVTERTYTFNEDGTGSVPVLEGTMNKNMTYVLEGSTLTIKRGELLDAITGEEKYTVKILGNTMTLTAQDGTSIELTKVK